MANNDDSIALTEMVDMAYALGCFGLITVCCLLICICYHCCLTNNENDFNTGNGFRRGREELFFRETVTTPAVMFSRRVGGSQASDSNFDEEDSIF